MTTVLEIIRPEPVKIRICGEEHEIRRLRYPAASKVMMLLAKIMMADGGKILAAVGNRSDTGGESKPIEFKAADLLALIANGTEDATELLRVLLAESLPTYEGSDELSVEDALSIAIEIWKVNRIPEMIPRFFARIRGPK